MTCQTGSGHYGHRSTDVLVSRRLTDNDLLHVVDDVNADAVGAVSCPFQSASLAGRQTLEFFAALRTKTTMRQIQNWKQQTHALLSRTASKYHTNHDYRPGEWEVGMEWNQIWITKKNSDVSLLLESWEKIKLTPELWVALSCECFEIVVEFGLGTVAFLLAIETLKQVPTPWADSVPLALHSTPPILKSSIFSLDRFFRSPFKSARCSDCVKCVTPHPPSSLLWPKKQK